MEVCACGGIICLKRSCECSQTLIKMIGSFRGSDSSVRCPAYLTAQREEMYFLSKTCMSQVKHVESFEKKRKNPA
jgi:hypothetical protein